MAKESAVKSGQSISAELVPYRSKPGEGHTQSQESLRNGRPNKMEAVRAVADLLSVKKSVLDTPSNTGSFKLPSISDSIEAIAHRLKSASNPKAEIGLPQISIDLRGLKLPEVIPTHLGNDSEALSSEPLKSDPIGGSCRSSGVGSREILNISESSIHQNTSKISKSVQSVPSNSVTSIRDEVAKLPDYRISTPLISVDDLHGPRETSLGTDDQLDVLHPMTVPGSAIGRSGALADTSSVKNQSLDSQPRPFVDSAPRLDAANFAGTRPPADSSRARLATKVYSVDLTRESGVLSTVADSRRLAELPRMGAEISLQGMSVGDPADSNSGTKPSMNLVRNPLSSELRNFSMANSAPPENLTSPVGQGGMRRSAGEDVSGAMPSSQEGSSMDLSKTNELLRQLVDAVRKQSGTSLPIAGPSVYAIR